MDVNGGTWSHEQYQKACEKVTQWDEAYYRQNHSLVDDTTYDIWYRQLLQYEEKHPSKRDVTSPTQRIQEPIKAIGIYQHQVPMLSMANTYSVEEIEQFNNKSQTKLGVQLEYCTEAKLDGLALSCIYEDGVLQRAVTRGDGKQGEDVTIQARAIYDIPLKIAYSGQVEIRGEVYLKKEHFNQINQVRSAQGKVPFANVRNVASGTLKTLDPKIVASRKLSFFAFALGVHQGLRCESQEQVLTNLKQWGMSVNPTFKIHHNIESVIQECQYWQEQRATLPYEIDGVVIKVNQIEHRESLGATSKIPHWQIAYKFPAQASISTIRAIDYQVSRLGVLSPVAILDPVYVSGSMVQRATLHNEDFIKHKEITVGCQVEIEKGGEVIPKVARRIGEAQAEAKTEKRRVPSHCPSCGVQVTYQSPYWVCQNTECTQRIQGEIEHFISKKGCDIDEIGPKAIHWLVQHHKITSWSDLFKMGFKQWLEVEHFAEKSAQKACLEFRRAGKKCLSRWIYGLGIRLIGEQAAQLIASQVGSLARFLQLQPGDLKLIYGLGELQQHQLWKFLNNPTHRKRLKEVIYLIGNIRYQYQKLPERGSKVQSIWVEKSLSPQERRELQQKREQAILIIRGDKKLIRRNIAYYQASLGCSKSIVIKQIQSGVIQVLGEWDTQLQQELQKVWGVTIKVTSSQDTKEQKSFIITGKLQLGTRNQWHERIKRCGDSIATTVQSAKILVVGEKPGSKLKKAQALKKEIWTEQELQQYCQESLRNS